MKQGAKVANTGRATDAPTTVNTVANQVFRLALFDHLPRKQVAKDPDSVEADRVLHLATIHLGLLFNKGLVQADDDRAEATGRAFLQIIQDYKTPPNKVLREDLDRYISKQVQYWVENRQISKSMGNVIKFVRSTISKISPELSEADAKASLLSDIRSFIDDKIVFARESVARYVTQTINDDDVILTFGSSPLIRQVLLYASHQRKFRLIVVDTRPLNEGLQTLAALSDVIHCVYSPLSGAPVALKEVNKVILGASCLLSNGSMLAPAGTAMVAALAKQRQIPVIVASESYKFSEKVQLDSIVFNELGHASEIVSVSKPGGASTTNDQEIYSTTFQASTTTTYSMAPQRQAGYRGSADKVSLKSISDGRADANNEDQIDHTEFIPVPQQQKQVNFSTIKLPFEVVNLRYDLTPITNISVIATETGLIPPTSIPVLIRENQNDHKHN